MLRLTPKSLLLMTALIHGIGTTLYASSGLSSPSLPRIHQSQRAYGQKAKANDKDVLALVTAAAKGDIRNVSKLLKKGIDINGKAPRDATDFGGQTALMAAAGSGHTDIVRILLDKGAKVNVRHEVGGTALTSAAAQGHLEVVEVLLAAGTDPNLLVASMHGQIYTALMFAMRSENRDWLKIVDSMIAAGAEVNPRFGFGISPLRLIIDKGDRTMLQALLKRGVDLNLRD